MVKLQSILWSDHNLVCCDATVVSVAIVPVVSSVSTHEARLVNASVLDQVAVVGTYLAFVHAFLGS